MYHQLFGGYLACSTRSVENKDGANRKWSGQINLGHLTSAERPADKAINLDWSMKITLRFSLCIHYKNTEKRQLSLLLLTWALYSLLQLHPLCFRPGQRSVTHEGKLGQTSERQPVAQRGDLQGRQQHARPEDRLPHRHTAHQRSQEPGPERYRTVQRTCFKTLR